MFDRRRRDPNEVELATMEYRAGDGEKDRRKEKPVRGIGILIIAITELVPTITSNHPGSTVRCIVISRNESLSGVTTNSTTLLSPGASVMRLKSFNSITGRVTELTRS